MMRIRLNSVFLAAPLLFTLSAAAQQKPPVTPARVQPYNLSREVSLQGTVVAYTAASTVAPLGAHVTVQTSSGPVDVHLGNARLLTDNHISLSAGDSVRIIGENVTRAENTNFLARILVKGNQQVALRSIRGIPFVASHAAGAAQTGQKQGGVL
jgi:hypothetical protein